MDVKKYIEDNKKGWLASMPIMIKGYTDEQLASQIELQKRIIKERLYNKVSTPAKTKRFLKLLSIEENLRINKK